MHSQEVTITITYDGRYGTWMPPADWDWQEIIDEGTDPGMYLVSLKAYSEPVEVDA